MHPALSIIVFTVTSGMGYGALAVAILGNLLGFAPYPGEASFYWTVGLGTVVIVGGLLSSTLHLANRRNAWRAFTRVRTSWLSREAVLAVAFFPVFGGYVLCLLAGFGRAAALLGWLSAALALATVVATGMIYACLRTIRQWRTPLTPIVYLLMGLALGALALSAQRAVEGGALEALDEVTFALLLLALAAKLVYYLQIGMPDAHGIDAATGFRLASVRLLDLGHTAGTFLTDEFGFRISRALALLLRALALSLAFVLPAVLVARAPDPGAAGALGALASGYLGALIERWLFFAEAQHVVRLYHGQRRA